MFEGFFNLVQSALTWRQGTKKQTSLDLAATAIAQKNYPALVTAAAEMNGLAKNHPHLLEPLLVIAKHLTESTRTYLPAGILSYRTVAVHAEPNSPAELKAIKAILHHAGDLPSIQERVEAYRDAALHVNTGTGLYQQAHTSFLFNLNGLPTIQERVKACIDAAIMATSGSKFQQSAIAWTMQHADELPTAAERINAYRSAAGLSSPESNVRHQAALRILKDADHLEDLASHMAAYQVAASLLTSDSKPHQQAVAGMLKLIPQLSENTERMDAYKLAAFHAASSPLEKQAVGAFIECANKLPTVAKRVEAFASILTRPTHSLYFEEQVGTHFMKNADALPTAEARVAAYSEIAHSSAPNTALRQMAVLGMFQHAEQFTGTFEQIGIYRDIVKRADADSDVGKAAARKLEALENVEKPLVPSPKSAKLFLQYTA